MVRRRRSSLISKTSKALLIDIGGYWSAKVVQYTYIGEVAAGDNIDSYNNMQLLYYKKALNDTISPSDRAILYLGGHLKFNFDLQNVANLTATGVFAMKVVLARNRMAAAAGAMYVVKRSIDGAPFDTTEYTDALPARLLQRRLPLHLRTAPNCSLIPQWITPT